MAKKGKEIRFIGGKYGGKKGWVDLDRTLGIDLPQSGSPFAR
jgi:hypothetical protein